MTGQAEGWTPRPLAASGEFERTAFVAGLRQQHRFRLGRWNTDRYGLY